MPTDLHGGLDEEERADVRRRAVPAIAAYRDGGCDSAPPVPATSSSR